MATPYDNEIKLLETRLQETEDELTVLRTRRANFLCPYKVGDIITNLKGDKQAQITRITERYGEYGMRGKLKLKNGFSTHERELWFFDWK